MQLNNTQAKKMQETLLTWIEALKRSSKAVLLVLATAVLLPAQTQAQSMGAAQVTLPNGYLNLRTNDLVVNSAMGPMRWTQEWDGHEWRFNPQWESLSQNWKNLTGSSSASAEIGATTSTGESGCWIWVDDDWQPSLRMTVGGSVVMVDGVAQANPMVAKRSTPFNRKISDGSSADYPPPQRVSLDYAALCPGTKAQFVDTEAIRRGSQLFMGDAGRYTFDNRSVLEKRLIQQLPAASTTASHTREDSTRTPPAPPASESNAKGFRWSKRNGDWMDYDAQGQGVAFGDRNGNTIWLQRDDQGRLLSTVDDSGHTLLSFHYTGELLTEVKDYPLATVAGDLPSRSIKYQYDDKNRLTQITDARGNTIQYAYDAANRLIRITDQEDRTERIAYTGDTVKQRIAPDGGVTDYEFDYDDVNKQFISKITGPETAAGRRVQDYTHNRQGQLVRYTVNGRTEAEIRYDTGYRAETRTNARGFATKTTKNEFEQIVETQYPDGSTQKTAYSALHMGMTEETDELGVKTKYEYDAKGNLLKTVQAAGTAEERVTEYEVDARGRITRATRKGRTESNASVTPDASWQVIYDAHGQIGQITDPQGKQHHYLFNRLGWLLQYTDPKSNIWRYTYDADGNLLSETDPLGQTSSNTYDRVGNRISSTDARGKITRYTYDAANRQLSQSDPLQGSYSVTYDARGALASVRDAGGKTMQLDYDALARLTQATDGKGQTYGVQYSDADGSDKHANQPSKIIYPTLQRVMRYNERDILSLKNDVAGNETRVESYGYDRMGQQKTTTNANGKTYSYEYSPHGQVTQIKDPMGNTMRVVYDTRGNVIEVLDPNNGRTRMEYDLRDLLLGSTDPLGNTTRYAWDDSGWLTQIQQANGQKIAYDHDAVGRVIQHREYDAQGSLKKTTRYSYDAADNLLTWNDGHYASVRIYDDVGRLSSETITYGVGASSFTLSHAYTYYGNHQIKTYTGPDGVTISYDYDGAAQLEKVSIPGEGNISVTDWQWFQPKKVLLPGGTERRLEYDGYQNLTQLKVVNPGQATVFELQNQYGKLAEIRQARIDGSTLGYTHDDAGRLTQVSAGLLSGRNESFTLDANGNRTRHSQSGTWNYDSAGQLMERSGAGGRVSYQYDASGNLTQKTDTSQSEPARTTHYAWDAFNRLSEVKDGEGRLIARYNYDPFDRRIRKELGDSVTLQSSTGAANTATYYLHTEWGLLAEADANGQITTSYGWNPQRENGVAPLYARVPDAATSEQWRTVHYHNDHLGTPQRITDKSGTLVWAADYDAYGKATTRTTTDTSKAVTNNLRYPGQYWDSETGLHYNDRRYYDPETGRYLSRDPIEFEGGINLYTYAAAAPGRYTDPTGEIIPVLLANYLRCNLLCNAVGAATDQLLCGEVNWAENAKDCLTSCLWSMLPIPDPCGKLGTLISVGVGVAGGLNSFAGETLVHVRGADGQPARRPIAQIRTGDEVLAWDEMAAHDGRIQTGLGARSTSATRYEKVTGIISNEKQQRLVHITLNSGNIISATDGHPFRTSEGWRDAILLKRGGQLLLGGDGNENDAAVTATIIDVRVEIKTIRVYNLEVKNLHTFFVGEDGLLVHNGNGSYTCYFVSGKKYHGKGDFNRAQQSAKEKANKYNDKVEKINWSDAKNDKQSFQHEHQRIQTDAFKVNGKDRPGYENNNNYNQRASPGAQFPLPRKKPPSGTDFRK
ncbi:hypothetical protein D8B23_14675 [Verminephrobacter aporrectodeae subsp. tuberculatae]|uniref:RHS repeat-associated core domain-containing protein n=1 Tax=Verminephrobacter aporrectodeae TaxID=1110389 RepID=UPI0022438CB3|nr:RHS repeat-associated core domain-containing protein [Verminephrobacter aporrectodeae]MCW8199631.1 hypothetical protein [Verminephrobacter aporrectodeae subsp. tuberculatae]